MVDILIVEDQKDLGQLLTDFLRAENYVVSCVETAEKALSLYDKYGARLLVLDLCLPQMDGLAVLNHVRKSANTPVLVVSAKNAKDDKLNAILAGADDYIEKPYDIDILIAKIRGIFKRRLATDTVTDGDLVLDVNKQQVIKNGRVLDLGLKEFELLKLFMENKGQTLMKEFLFNTVWGSDSDSEMQTLTVHIKYLREKIEDDPKNPKRLVTVWGKGYRFE
ncbi:MAG: response regulator transcription factor [Lachnospiraceae bacterium]|nr:response regulator transcription factor [Lachnospiraceae bacterium]MBR5348642.1 response regulator transcription factor [Lachnospiraceae bacterium]MBR5658820.1 response regulator transcription factor [Lachnospiraceae bacterium]